MLSGYTAYTLSNTIAVRARSARCGMTSGVAPYTPRYCAAVDSRLTSTTFRPAAAPRKLERSMDLVRSKPRPRQAESAARATTCGIIEPASAVHALRTSPSVSTCATAVGPSATHTTSGATIGRRATRRAHQGARDATADTVTTSSTFVQVA